MKINTSIAFAVLGGYLSLSTPFLQAAVPASYYDQADTSTSQNLHQSLHSIIDDHTRIPYTSTAIDTWDVLETADEDPNNPNNVITIYKNASYNKVGGGNTSYNREHSWPKSYGFPNDGASNYPYTDMHHLFIADSSYNSSRSNKPYANCDSGCSEKITEVNAGTGGQGGDWSNWTAGAGSTGSWETWLDRRGNVARALMYLAVRYEGGTHGISGYSEPDLILTDDRNLMESHKTGSNGSVAYMGLRSVLIQWHKDDPVDDLERRHNDTVFDYQGNRNPFVDHPEWVACVFENVCSGDPGDTTPPLVPTGLSGTGGNQSADLSWVANSESDLFGYHVYRSTNMSGPYTRADSGVVIGTSYTDSNLTDSTTYYYVVAAVDTSSNQSSYSNEISITTDEGTAPPSSGVWINEFHYDNDGTDTNEFVEVAGAAGSNLTGWSVVGYNGNGGSSYKSVNLSGTITDQQGGLGTLQFAFTSMQNGSPDGLALVNASGVAVQFISYEGSFTAVGGPANGMVSTDIGVSEVSTTPIGYSLQLSGSGSQYSDFIWSSAGSHTAGQVNTSQSFSGQPPVNQAPTASFTFNCTDLTCDLDGNTSSDPDGSISSYSWDLGDGNTSTSASLSHAYASAGSYTVILTVTDNEGATGFVSQTVTVTDPPVNQPPTSSFSYVANELMVDFTSNSSDPEGSLSNWSWDFGDGSTSTQANPSYEYATEGTYTVSLMVTDAGGLSDTSVQNVTLSIAPVVITPLVKDIAQSNLSGIAGEELLFSFDVPVDATSVTFTMSGGTGDADLYVSLNQVPTTSVSDCSPFLTGNNETCDFTNSGTYYVMVHGAANFSGANLTATYQVGSTGYSETINNISVNRRDWVYYQFEVTAGTTSLDISTTGGSGNADLYVSYASQPSKRSYDCRSTSGNNQEICSFTNPSAGTWHIGIRGTKAASGITLTSSAQ